MTDLPSLWRQGRTTFGAWISLREPFLAEIAATSGYDYVCVDMQHGLSDLEHVRQALQAMARTPTVPISRVPWNEPGIIGQALDAGALGIIIPMVNSPDEAERAVAACRYAPDGARSFGPLVAGARAGAQYFAAANTTVACIPMIETRQAVEQIDDILSVPGIDAIYVGPADLSVSYGLAPRVDQDDAVFVDALAQVVAACERHGVVPGIHASAPLAGIRHTAGFRMMTVGFDASPAMQALRADIKTAQAAISST
ncbi:MAG TPA: aldolase/citrate lyase family protein [Acidimicrobiales bacterium]|nr:aldolase/citrate lyase family protein [Acidimicrobiales bacterium]